MVTAIAACTAAISRLDARVSVSSVAKPWQRRAAWSGYTRALQLQSAELDEIDVFSWGCGLQIPGRGTRTTHLDHFDAFGTWCAALANPDRLAWRDGLPTAIGEPEAAARHPALIRALDAVRQYARTDGGIIPWLALPFALRDANASSAPLPCLAGGAKAFRLKRTISGPDWLVAVRDLEARAQVALDRLDGLERAYRDAARAIVAEYRPGALPALLALSQHRPLLSPQAAAEILGLSIGGASKLLDRASDLGLLVEITQRRTWRQFLTPDLALAFGYVSAKRGRPAREPPALPHDRDMAAVFDDFDAEMARIDALLAASSSGTGHPAN